MSIFFDQQLIKPLNCREICKFKGKNQTLNLIVRYLF